jgi:hypothetical protein
MPDEDLYEGLERLQRKLDDVIAAQRLPKPQQSDTARAEQKNHEAQLREQIRALKAKLKLP